MCMIKSCINWRIQESTPWHVTHNYTKYMLVYLKIKLYVWFIKISYKQYPFSFTSVHQQQLYEKTHNWSMSCWDRRSKVWKQSQEEGGKSALPLGPLDSQYEQMWLWNVWLKGPKSTAKCISPDQLDSFNLAYFCDPSGVGLYWALLLCVSRPCVILRQSPTNCGPKVTSLIVSSNCCLKSESCF